MNFTTLYNFRAVAQSQHMTQSAKELNIAQPALSRSIRQLEQEVGQTLFIRHRNRLRLNAAGEVLLQATENILAAWERALKDVQGPFPEQEIVLNISSAEATMPDLLKAFCALHPEAVFTIHGNYAPLGGDLLCDFFIFASQKEELMDNMVLLRKEELYLTVGREHPLVGRSSVALAECKDMPFLFADVYNDMYAIQNHFCQLAGFEPLVQMKIEKQNILIGLVGLNQGVAILPHLGDARCVQIPISDVLCQRYVYMMRNPSRKSHVLMGAFEDFCVTFFAKLGKDAISEELEQLPL